MNLTFPDIVFVILAALILGCGSIVAYSRNIVRAGFSLLGAFAGVAGLYFLAQANFIGAAQILIYVGGVLVVILFAIMLTRGIEQARSTNPRQMVIPATLIGLISAAMLITIALYFPWRLRPDAPVATVHSLGNALLDTYLIPFEFLSLLLLAAMIGAVMLVRKEIKESGKEESR